MKDKHEWDWLACFFPIGGAIMITAVAFPPLFCIGFPLMMMGFVRMVMNGEGEG